MGKKPSFSEATGGCLTCQFYPPQKKPADLHDRVDTTSAETGRVFFLQTGTSNRFQEIFLKNHLISIENCFFVFFNANWLSSLKEKQTHPSYMFGQIIPRPHTGPWAPKR